MNNEYTPCFTFATKLHSSHRYQANIDFKFSPRTVLTPDQYNGSTTVVFGLKFYRKNRQKIHRSRYRSCIL